MCERLRGVRRTEARGRCGIFMKGFAECRRWSTSGASHSEQAFHPASQLPALKLLDWADPRGRKDKGRKKEREIGRHVKACGANQHHIIL